LVITKKAAFCSAVYLKSGAAVTSTRFSVLTTFNNVALASARATRWGGIVGVGGRLCAELVVRIEYARRMVTAWINIASDAHQPAAKY
jgi:hypothetical protein